ncbi:YwiC-like protein [Cricetibacter osteomyelitidis]|uniref:YwiC-like protein n=1 Tax=Cricetibacter osteomyelitidis TaxID=1521931 RepID=A0A4R2TCI8_9PAST|nr:YwiC-like family protein [Cricetibacter osteomyelitidis]TCP94808.1 YwiC-like protein [Cricetibacter osteomyelitidis]
MKLLISNQHGAIVMALLPFLYGMLSRSLIWQDIFLLLAWCSLYLFTYPFFSLFKGKNLAKYQKWTFIYGIASAVFSVPVFLYHWQTVYAIVAMLPFSALSIYFVKKKDERNLLNDFAGIAIFAIAGIMAYEFNHPLDLHAINIALYPSLFFIGTTLYVKSSMRERKNPKYYYVSLLFHVACLLLCAALQHWWLTGAFIIALIRAYWLPRQKLSVKQIGLIEMVVSLLFFIALLI